MTGDTNDDRRAALRSISVIEPWGTDRARLAPVTGGGRLGATDHRVTGVLDLVGTAGFTGVLSPGWGHRPRASLPVMTWPVAAWRSAVAQAASDTGSVVEPVRHPRTRPEPAPSETPRPTSGRDPSPIAGQPSTGPSPQTTRSVPDRDPLQVPEPPLRITRTRPVERVSRPVSPRSSLVLSRESVVRDPSAGRETGEPAGEDDGPTDRRQTGVASDRVGRERPHVEERRASRHDESVVSEPAPEHGSETVRPSRGADVRRATAEPPEQESAGGESATFPDRARPWRPDERPGVGTARSGASDRPDTPAPPGVRHDISITTARVTEQLSNQLTEPGATARSAVSREPATGRARWRGWHPVLPRPAVSRSERDQDTAGRPLDTPERRAHRSPETQPPTDRPAPGNRTARTDERPKSSPLPTEREGPVDDRVAEPDRRESPATRRELAAGDEQSGRRPPEQTRRGDGRTRTHGETTPRPRPWSDVTAPPDGRETSLSRLVARRSYGQPRGDTAAVGTVERAPVALRTTTDQETVRTGAGDEAASPRAVRTVLRRPPASGFDERDAVPDRQHPTGTAASAPGATEVRSSEPPPERSPRTTISAVGETNEPQETATGPGGRPTDGTAERSGRDRTSGPWSGVQGGEGVRHSPGLETVTPRVHRLPTVTTRRTGPGGRRATVSGGPGGEWPPLDLAARRRRGRGGSPARADLGTASTDVGGTASVEGTTETGVTTDTRGTADVEETTDVRRLTAVAGGRTVRVLEPVPETEVGQRDRITTHHVSDSGGGWGKESSTTVTEITTQPQGTEMPSLTFQTRRTPTTKPGPGPADRSARAAVDTGARTGGMPGPQQPDRPVSSPAEASTGSPPRAVRDVPGAGWQDAGRAAEQRDAPSGRDHGHDLDLVDVFFGRSGGVPAHDADVDRLVENLYRAIERKMRIERERRGL